jgi:lipopolysaccharide export system permease protein
MILRCLWERTIFRTLCANFFLVLGCLFSFFIILDYTFHAQELLQGHVWRSSQLFFYYAFHFAKQADLLLPLSLLIASLKTLFSLNAQGMLVTLRASGISSHRLMRPCILLAFLCTFTIYLNYEFALPKSLTFLKQFRNVHFKHVGKPRSKKGVQVFFLQDQSKVLYSHETANYYRDVYWIANPNEIWHMQSLSKESPNPKGLFVDHLVRGSDNRFEKCDSHPVCLFSGMIPQPDPTGKGYIPAENRKMSELFFLNQRGVQDPAHISTALVYKGFFPLISLLIAFAMPMLGFQHKRRVRAFFTYALSLFAFVALVSFFNACVILGESGILSPYFGILVPFTLLFVILGRRWVNNP